MKPRIIRGSEAASADYVAALPHSAAGEIYRSPDRIAGGFGPPDQLQANPVVVIRIHVA